MAHRSKTAAFLLVVLLMFMPFTPVVSADGGTQAPASYAFLPSWSGAISGDLDQSGDSPTHEFTNHDFDDEGNKIITFEGVFYKVDSDGDVLNPDDYSVVGTWDKDMCELIFTDDEERDAHQGRKNTL